MAKQPNILLFFTDQQRFDTIRALGNPVIRTPNLDRIANAGVAFTSAYSPSPVCVPARCALHYGQYPWRTGCADNSDPMPEDRPSFMDALSKAGYKTHGIGKCHFTPDPLALRGFDSRETQEEMVDDPTTDDYHMFLRKNGGAHLTDPHGVRGEMYYVPQPAQMSARLHPTQWIGDRAVRFVEKEKRNTTPWMLYCSFVHPHPPFAPPAPWHKLYRSPMMPLPKLPPDYKALHTHINRNQNRYKFRDQGLDMNLIRSIRAYYYACISFVDYQIGRVLDALEQSGQIKDTIIIVTADHGEHLGDYGCFGKRSMHDTCMRVPMLVSQPRRFTGGKRISAPASLIDVAPTMLSAAGVTDHGMDLDGVDLRDLAAGKTKRFGVCSQYQHAGNAIYSAVTDRWKYAYSAPDQREFLFDRVGDPAETRDRARLTFMAEDLKAMRGLLVGTLREAGLHDALDGNAFRAYPRKAMPSDPDAGLLIQDHRWADQRIEGYSG